MVSFFLDQASKNIIPLTTASWYSSIGKELQECNLRAIWSNDFFEMVLMGSG